MKKTYDGIMIIVGIAISVVIVTSLWVMLYGGKGKLLLSPWIKTVSHDGHTFVTFGPSGIIHHPSCKCIVDAKAEEK